MHKANYKLFENDTIRKALLVIKKCGLRCAVVVDKSNKLLGTITDGDIRKAILKNVKINERVKNYYNKKSKFFIKGRFSNKESKDLLLKQNYPIIPIVDKNKKVIDYLTSENIFGKNKKIYRNLNVPLVIMAGGKGTRLEPFTKILPKPLIPINGKPVIELIIEKFLNFKIKKVIFSINYKSDIIKAYFKNLNPNYKIDFIEEKSRLGTAGSLAFLLRQNYNDFFVTNCDTIIDIDYSEFYDFHKKNNFDISVVVAMKDYKIPYGVCELHNTGFLKSIKEKPTFNVLANVGFYLVTKSSLKFIKRNQNLDFTDFIKNLQKNKKKIGVFPIHEKDWVDVGQWKEFKKSLSSIL